MSADALNPCPDTPAPGPADERRRALLDRQLERLDGLIGAGMDLVQGLAAQASGAGPRIVEGDLILAYSRAARAVRMAILLQSHLVAAPEVRKDAGAPDQTLNAAGAGPAPDTALAERAAAGEEAPESFTESAEDADGREGDPVERAERPMREYAERLERDDIYHLVLTRPADELIVEIANDLGLAPDWPDDTPPEPRGSGAADGLAPPWRGARRRPLPRAGKAAPEEVERAFRRESG